MNAAAQALGRRAKGKPKNFSPEEKARRRAKMQALNAARQWHRVETNCYSVAASHLGKTPLDPFGQPLNNQMFQFREDQGEVYLHGSIKHKGQPTDLVIFLR